MKGEVFLVEIFKSVNNSVMNIEEIESGCWIHLVKPTEEELEKIEKEIDIEPDFLRAALDPEETPRIETENGQTLIIVDVPIVASSEDRSVYTTMPLGIISLKHYFVTVCLKEGQFIRNFYNNRVKDFYTQFKTRFTLQILYRNAGQYLNYLRAIEKASNRLEEVMFKSMKNQELLKLLRLEKSLVYFSTSLRANQIVLERWMRNPNLKNYPEDEELLDDVMIENRQAIEMSNIYSTILSNTTESFAGIISNNQNNVMKILTSVTLVMVIPETIAALFGMNVSLPFSEYSFAFWIILGIIAVLCGSLIFYLNRKNMF